MDFTFEAISAAEHDRLQALYAPLTQAVRRLIQAGIRTGEDEETIREAQTAIEAVVQKLEGTLDDEPAAPCRERAPSGVGEPGDRVAQCDRPAARHARGPGWLVVE